jgi:hypothetical protein
MPTAMCRDRPAASSSGKRLLGKDAMKVENRVPAEADFIRRVHEKLDRFLVVDDHLRFEAVAARGLLAKFDEALGIEQRAGVALKAA